MGLAPKSKVLPPARALDDDEFPLRRRIVEKALDCGELIRPEGRRSEHARRVAVEVVRKGRIGRDAVVVAATLRIVVGVGAHRLIAVDGVGRIHLLYWMDFFEFEQFLLLLLRLYRAHLLSGDSYSGRESGGNFSKKRDVGEAWVDPVPWWMREAGHGWVELLMCESWGEAVVMCKFCTFQTW